MCASEVKKRCTCKDALQVSKHVDTGRNKTKRREKEEDETKFQWILSVVSGVSQVCEISGIRYGNGNARDPWEGSLWSLWSLSLTLRPSQLSTVRFGRGEGVRMRLFHSWLWKFRGEGQCCLRFGFGSCGMAWAWFGLDYGWCVDSLGFW